MTKEPIMIDGVDIAGCKFYTQGATGMICADWHLSNDCNKNPNCDYKLLKQKEQECDQLKAENEKMSKGYIELTEIVSPYIDDFTGYNEELKGFDIVLCVKELMQQLDQLQAEKNNQITKDNINDIFKKTIEYHKNNANLTTYEIDNTTYVIQLEKVICKIEEELDQLKAKYKTLLLEHSGCYRKEWVDEQIRIKKIYEEDRQNYWQALHEIKKIAEDDCKTCTVKLLGEDEIICKRCYKTKILRKCEVIDE